MQLNRLQLSGSGLKTYRVALQMNGKSRILLLKFRFNRRAAIWNMTVIDPADQSEIVSNIPLLVTRTATNVNYSCIRPLGYNGLGLAFLYPKTGDEPEFTSDIDGLWNNYELQWMTEE